MNDPSINDSATNDAATHDDHFVSWLHLGDLHASDEDGWDSVETLARIVASVGEHVPPGALDFAFLPGDNANHGEPAQYERVAQVLARLAMPLHAIPGDHDFEPGSLDRFHVLLADQALPGEVRVNGRRALFLDIVSAGGGGPDFRLGDDQTCWLRDQLHASRAAAEPRPLVFMHAFPSDLRHDGQRIGRLFAEAEVAFVDTGHTHYNELLNDGAVIYSATRSTGQIEEGEAGFAVAAVDGHAASWRFKTLASSWPWVMVTSPADGRMTVARDAAEAAASRRVNALVLGRDIATVSLQVDDGPSIAMRPMPGRAGRWTATVDRPLAGVGRLVVIARSGDGRSAFDEVRPHAPRTDDRTVPLGHHDATIGEWPEHGLLGTRLGPNANGKDW